MSDDPISEQYLAQMHGLMGVVDEVFNGKSSGAARKTGVILLVFPMNAEGDAPVPGRCNYMSNGANRDDVKAMFKQVIARWEGQAPTSGTA